MTGALVLANRKPWPAPGEARSPANRESGACCRLLVAVKKGDAAAGFSGCNGVQVPVGDAPVAATAPRPSVRLAEPELSAVLVAWLPARLGRIGATGRLRAGGNSRFGLVFTPPDTLVTCA